MRPMSGYERKLKSLTLCNVLKRMTLSWLYYVVLKTTDGQRDKSSANLVY